MHLVGELDLTWMQSQVFPQGVLAAITLMRGCMEMEWVELELGVKWKLLSIQWSFIALLGLESDPKMLELKALTVGSKWMLLLLPVLELLRQKGYCWSKGILACSQLMYAEDRDPSFLQWAAYAGADSCFICSVQTQPVYNSPLSLSWSLLPVSTPPASCGYAPQGRQAHMDSQHILVCELWWSNYHQSSMLPQMCCLSKCQQWSLPTNPGSTLGHHCVTQPSFLPRHGSPKSCAMLQHRPRRLECSLSSCWCAHQGKPSNH